MPVNRLLVDESRYRLDEARLRLASFGRLPATLRDLVRIAMAAYTADRLQRRPADGHGTSREMPLTVPVTDCGFWKSPRISSQLHEILQHLSGDHWAIEFVAASAAAKTQHHWDFRERHTPVVALYSGGLDSAAGLVSRLNDREKRIVCVTACHQAGLKDLVRQQLWLVKQQMPGRVRSVAIKTCLRDAPLRRHQESTQRARSLLFAVLGAVVATSHAADRVEVFEHGVGAINLPPMPGMLVGGRASRSASPRFLGMIGCFVSELIDREFRFVLPFLSKTKAELVQSLSLAGLEDLASLSASCVRFPLRRKDRVKHCGVCPGCLGRRQALWHAGLCDVTPYEIDVFDPRTASDEIPWRKMAPLNAYLLQTAELSRIANEAQAPAWILDHLKNVGVADTALECRKSLAILRRHADEWTRLIKYGADIGYDWARRFGPVASNHRGVLA